MTGIKAEIKGGYTGADHLITQADRDAATAAVAGRTFRRASDARSAADRAYCKSCDRRVRLARVVVTLRNARGDLVEVG